MTYAGLTFKQINKGVPPEKLDELIADLIHAEPSREVFDVAVGVAIMLPTSDYERFYLLERIAVRAREIAERRAA